MDDLQDTGTDQDHLSPPFTEDDDLNTQASDASPSTVDDLTTVQSSSALYPFAEEDIRDDPTNSSRTSSLQQGNMISYSVEYPLELTVITEEAKSEDTVAPVPTVDSSMTEIYSPASDTITPPSALNSGMLNIDNPEQYYVSPLEKFTFKNESFNQLPSQDDVCESSLVGDWDENQSLTLTKEKNFQLNSTVSEMEELMQTQVNGRNDLVKGSTDDADAVGHIESGASNNYFEIHSPVESEDFHLPNAMPAPISPAAALPATLGKVVVPALVDHMQEQAVAALQALKVIEAGVEPGAICTRREYARWLIAASGMLTRSPAHKVFPAMYIEYISESAFDDVSPQDPDFPYIQGLAEAGLISSKFTRRDMLGVSGNQASLDESKEFLFFPDSPVTRQDLVSWKIALEKRLNPVVSKEVLHTKSGFIDVNKIHKDAWPALLIDLSAGERGIMALAFGYIRRFQPDKPVTKAQAAIALSTGEAADVVSEELTRLEAESIAEAAVAAELAMESKAQQEVALTLNQRLEEEKAKKEAANKSLELMHAELQRLKAEMDEEKYSILKEHAVVESERDFLSRLQKEVEEKSESLTNVKLEVAFEKERIEKLRSEAESERLVLANLRTQLEVEKRALIMARSWAEDEAKKAYSHAKVLEAARKRWEDQGVEVHVDKALDESNIPAISWPQSNDFQERSSSMTSLLVKSRNFRWEVTDALSIFLYRVQAAANQSKNRATEALKEVGKRAADLKNNITSTAGKRAQELQGVIYSASCSITSDIWDGTKKVVDECKGGAEKLAQKLKST